MEWTDFVGAVCAALSLAGAAFAWWRANLSKKAKVEAEQASQRAEDARRLAVERADAARAAAEHLEQLADMIAGPPLTLRLERPGESQYLWLLRSNRPEPLTVTEIVNADAFTKFRAPALPFTLGAWQAAEVLAAVSWENKHQLGLELRVEDFDQVVHAVFER